MADFIDSLLTMLGWLIGGGIVLTVAWLVYRRRYRRIGPDEALIVYGSRARKDRDGFRVIVGGGTFVKPFIEEAEKFPLHAMQLDVVLAGVLAGDQRTPVNVNGTATVKVPVNPEERAEGFPTVRQAASNFLGMSVDEINNSLTKVVAGHLRTIVAGLTVAELYSDQARFTEELKSKAAGELQSLGYAFLSFVFESITDDNGYLDALGVPEIERARRDARISQANNDRDATLQEESARLQKEQRTFEVEAEIAEAEKQLNLKRASIQEEVDVAQASAVKAGQLQAKEEDIRLAELEAEAQARQARDVGLAEADAIRAKGEAEADARRLLADALRQYNEAGVSLEALKVLPEIVAAASEPLSRAGKTTIISNGSGTGTGVSKLTGDVTEVLSTTLPVVKDLSGVDLAQIVRSALGSGSDDADELDEGNDA